MVKSGFLCYNYDVPEVMRVIDRIEVQMTGDFPNEMVEAFASCKSGEAKSHLIAMRSHFGDPMPEPFVGYDEAPYLRMAAGDVNLATKLLEAVLKISIRRLGIASACS